MHANVFGNNTLGLWAGRHSAQDRARLALSGGDGYATAGLAP